MKPQHHFLVCLNQRAEGHPRGSCAALGSKAVFDALRDEVERRGLFGVQVTGTGCLGPCDQGPTVVVYPEGVWYGKVSPTDAGELLDSHVQQRGPVKRLELVEA